MYAMGKIHKDEMIQAIMTRNAILTLEKEYEKKGEESSLIKAFPFFKEIYPPVKEYILDQELKRGESATSFTILASAIDYLYGAERFSQILAALGKTDLKKGFVSDYTRRAPTRQEQLSRLLKCCMPLASDTQAVFDASMKQIKVSDKQLLEAAIYNPAWEKFIHNYLNYPGMGSAI